jgi:hypothetical protein
VSQSLNAVNVTVFEKELKLIFQPKMMDIKNLCRVKNSEGAKIVEFPLYGDAVTSKRENLQTPIPVYGVGQSKVQCIPEDFTLSEITDIFGQAKVPYDEIRALVETFGMAAKRRMVQFLVDALAAATYAPGKTIAKNISGVNDNLNMAMLRGVSKALDVDGVDSEGRTLLVHPNGLHYLTGETQVASADYNSLQVLIKGGLDAYYGLNFFRVPNLKEGGLPLATPDRTNFAFQKMAVGLAINMEPMTRTDWDPQYGGWRTTLFMSGKACIIDPLGVVKITTDDTLNR